MNNRTSLFLMACLAAGVAALSTSAIFVKLTDAPASALAAYRLLLSALFVLPVLFLSAGGWRSLLRLRGKPLLLVLLAAGLLALHYSLWFASLRYTSVVSSTVLVCMQPMFSLFGAFLWFGEKQSRYALAGSLVAAAGCFIIGWGDMGTGGTALFGDALALLAAAAMAVYFLIGQKVKSTIPLSALSFATYAGSGSLLAVYSLLLGVPMTGYDWGDWRSFLGLAIVPTLIGQSILNALIRRVGASTVSMAIVGEPIGTAILAYLLLGEIVTMQQTVGSVVMLAGIVWFMASRSPDVPRDQARPAKGKKPLSASELPQGSGM